MAGPNQFLVFTLDGQLYGLDLSVVERVIRAEEVMPLPKAPEIVMGVINVRGEIVPVINLRRRFGLPERPVTDDDQMILTTTMRRRVALIADSVRKVVNCMEGIHDLETLLSMDELTALDVAMEAGKRRILKACAQKPAREPRTEAEPADQLEVIEFRLSQEHYAIESARVQEVYPLKDLTPVPCTPAFVLGLINVRGQIRSVIDLKRFFGLPAQESGIHGSAIILRWGEIETGILADEVIGVRRLAPEGLQPAPATLLGIRDDYLKGITCDRLAVIDVEKLLSDPGIIVREEVEVGLH
jgi:purine-binding chemotaxis protein CheW